ncbi:hypothetical protein F4809DRAFT_601791 [Biscogniauxia mediterranea]|nr:hypothetical protein F4809DRAFT_601791 [Biscogniauxia mediterranea]
MAPNFRPNTQTRRGNRSGYVEHDDFEGLPVRQWRQEWVSIAPPPPPDTTQKNDVWAIELPHGMPKDSHLLPTHTQELLRAARSGRLYKRPPPAEEEEGDADAVLTEKADKKEDDLSTKGFQVKVWKQIPRNAEGPTVSHLAKRRKGTVTLSSDLPAGAPSGPTVTKATVRRIDAAGNPYTQEVTLNEGQPIDGEIISTTVVPAPNPNANGDASAAATPVRRRPPPPKRKPKGPGRGRKKKLPLPPSTRPGPSAPGAVGAPDSTKPEGVEINTNQPASHNDTKNQDTEMADDDDGDDGEDDGDDGDDGDEGDEEDGELPEGENGPESRADSEVKPDPVDSTTTPDQDAVTVQDTTVTETAVTQGLPLPQGASPPSTLGPSSALPPLHLPANHLEGSPLKNVVPAESPTDQLSERPPQSETPVILADAVSGTEPPPVSSETAPEPVQSTDPVSLPSAPEESTAPTSITEVRHDVDTEMTDAIPGEAGGPTETTSETTTETTTETEMVEAVNHPETMVIEETQQEIEPPPIDPPQDSHQLPSIEPALIEEVIEAPKSATETPGSNQPPIVPVMESVTHSAGDDIAKEKPTVETNAPEPLPESADPAPGITANDEAVSGPEVIDTRVEPVAPQAADEPESPDLFSGLEAALNQQGPKEEPTSSGDHGAASQETETPTPLEGSVPETIQ